MSHFLSLLYEKRDHIHDQLERWATPDNQYRPMYDRLQRNLEEIGVLIDAAERLEMKHRCIELDRAQSAIHGSAEEDLPYGTTLPAVTRITYWKWSWFAENNEDGALPIRFCPACGTELEILPEWRKEREESWHDWLEYNHVL